MNRSGPMNPCPPLLRRTAVPVALLLAIALTGCTGGSSDAPPSTSSSSTTEGTPNVTTREAVLNRLAADLRTTVDGLAEPLKPQTTHRYLVGDDAEGCHLGDDADGPQQWSYALSLDMSAPDTGPLARTAGETLAAHGWSIREEPANDGEVHLTAQKAGASIALKGGGRAPHTVLLDGYTACVSSDGTVDIRTLP